MADLALGVLIVGGWLLGESFTATACNRGTSQTRLGNTALAASLEADELARVAATAFATSPDGRSFRRVPRWGDRAVKPTFQSRPVDARR